jgi:hypothetical protein
MKGKWAQGIVPRNFAWVIKDQLAVCERIGGYGANHRKVRRQEEIIWVREQGFARIISLLPSPHNLHAYDDIATALEPFWRDLREQLGAGDRLIVHHDELGDRLQGAIAGYLVYAGLVDEVPRAVAMTEHVLHRPMGPEARDIVAVAKKLVSKS